MAIAQNSGGTAVARVRGRPFPKGVSGNPSGRPRGLVHAIRDATDDGSELVTFMLRILRGGDGARVRDRIEAATWLADRGFGKPVPAPPASEDDGRIALETIRSLMSASSDPNRVYDY